MEQNKDVLLTKEKEWFILADSLDWKSYDPMDILHSPYLAQVQNLSSFAARVLVQVGMRSGSSIRRLLKIEPHEEAKTLSDFLSAAVILYKCQQDWVEDYISMIDVRLRKKAINTTHGWGWGLEFPYSTRFGNASARTPNIYQTTNALQAFLDVYELNNDKETLQYVSNGIKFILEDLGDFEYKGLKWFRYFPGRSHPVINIQASLASLFARYGSLVENRLLVDISDQVAHTVIEAQQIDGSWLYSYDNKANFIDGFHTGFILQGLTEYSNYRKNDALVDIRKTIEKGFDFFINHLVIPTGLPRYYANGRSKPDGQNFAQCIQALVICSCSFDHVNLAMRVWENMIRILHLDSPQDLFSKIILPNRYPQLRWTFAPIVLATAHLILYYPSVNLDSKK